MATARIDRPFRVPPGLSNGNGDTMLLRRAVLVDEKEVGFIATIETRFGGVCYRVVLPNGWVEDHDRLSLAKRRALAEMNRRVTA